MVMEENILYVHKTFLEEHIKHSYRVLPIETKTEDVGRENLVLFYEDDDVDIKIIYSDINVNVNYSVRKIDNF